MGEYLSVQGKTGVVAVDMAAVPLGPKRWTSTAAAVHAAVNSEPAIDRQVLEHETTYAFRTREGAMGVIEVSGFGTEPPMRLVTYELIASTSPPPEVNDWKRDLRTSLRWLRRAVTAHVLVSYGMVPLLIIFGSPPWPHRRLLTH